jgi:hypothetical protein
MEKEASQVHIIHTTVTPDIRTSFLGFTAATVQIVVIWDVTPCRWLTKFRRNMILPPSRSKCFEDTNKLFHREVVSSHTDPRKGDTIIT